MISNVLRQTAILNIQIKTIDSWSINLNDKENF